VGGDWVIVALSTYPPRSAGDSGLTWELLSYDSALFLVDGEVVDTPRTNPVIIELEKLTEQDAKDRIRCEANKP